LTHSDFAIAKGTPQSEIPIIDVSSAVDGTDVKGVAAQIYRAATDHGFFTSRTMASRKILSIKLLPFPKRSSHSHRR